MPLKDFAEQQWNQGLQAANPIKPSDIFDDLRQAQSAYRDACFAYQKAAEQREVCAANLKELSEKANNVIHLAMQDPTVPQQDSCPPPRNGRY